MASSQYVDADEFVADLVQVRRDVVGRVDERLAHRGGRGGQRGGGQAHRRCRGFGARRPAQREARWCCGRRGGR